ncbi:MULTISPECIES: CPBP family intramembrane glutamic endopeptidase [Thioclava]|uniref:CPBP family intramembrane glutamic endopeptidase n=1 Tax=Thioclava kandeliae TaxID=3070818 RepID=A0ABV1SJV5_9RHOB
MPHYPLLDRFTAPARAHCALWRTLIGLIAIVVIYGLGASILVGTSLAHTSGLARMFRLQEIANGSSPFGVAVLLGSFLPLVAGVMTVTQYLGKRTPRSLLGKGTGSDFRRAFWPLLALTIILAWFTSMAPDVGHSTALSAALPWWPLIIPLVFLQIGAEEVLFRGYLMQQLGAWSGNNLWITMGLPSLLFGALHYDGTTFGAMSFWPVVWAAFYGLLAADLTARTGNLGAALAFHFVNNLSAILLISYYGHLDGISLFSVVANLQDFNTIAPLMLVDGASITVSWLLIRLSLRV